MKLDYDPWKDSVTLQSRVYKVWLRVQKNDLWRTDPEFQYYLQTFGTDKVKRWIESERNKKGVEK
jgi:hypothetical protein